MALKSLRFALGTPDLPRSGLWHLWVQEDDVHLDVETAPHTLAFTAYKTGRWRIAAGAAISRWTRPKDFRPGWTRGPDLLVPGSTYPLHLPNSKPTEPVTWLPLPFPGSIARFSMLFAGPRSTDYPWRPANIAGSTDIAVLALRTMGSLYLCRRDEPDDDPEPGTAGAEFQALVVRISADQAGVPSLRESYRA